MSTQTLGITTPVVEPDSTQKVWPTYDHVIGLTESRELIARYQKANPGKIHASAFTRVAFERILAQEGCCGIRSYYAQKEDGTITLVMVGVDQVGNDMDDGELAEEAWPCPPICPNYSAMDS